MLRLTINILILLLFYYPLSGVSGAAHIEDMELRGTGEVYYLGFIKVYDAALYSEELAAGDDILDHSISKCLDLRYAVSVDAEDFIAAASTVLKRQFPPARLDQVASHIDSLHAGYKDVQEGDRYSLCYSKLSGETILALNGNEIITVSAPEFAEIYFSIWLGKNDPLDERLRNDLLANVVVQ